MIKRFEQFYKKIHNPKSKIPEYCTIIVRPGKKLIDFKIKKEDANILKVMAHDQKSSGWFLHSVHIPLKNLGLSYSAKNKEILEFLSQPNKITSSKPTKDYIVKRFLTILF
jgi:hypothetical protein